ncbi:plasmid maintenance protein (plasmid) [Borreliella sinica]|uniref:plasmid maintenance protein n=1 Tax=Borreliella sinica TaxID=87162 RepID=UPI003AEFBCEB
MGHGSVAHYIQNMELAAYHKEIIWEHLVGLLEERLANKKIVGDFDEDIKNAVFKTRNSYNFSKNNFLQKKCSSYTPSNNTFPSKLSDNSSESFVDSRDIASVNVNTTSRVNTMSPHSPSPVFNKANISNIKYKNSKNSNINSKILKNNKPLEKKDIEDRLKKSGIENNFLYKIKDLSNNESTYLNALNNLETALDEHKDNKLKYVLEHFLEQFSNYRYKVWMMMKRNDGVISDYELIWGERFRDFVKKKVGLSDYVKKVLEMEARERENRSRERMEGGLIVKFIRISKNRQIVNYENQIIMSKIV